MHQIKEKDWHFDLKGGYVLTVLHTTLKFCYIYNFPLVNKPHVGCQLRVQVSPFYVNLTVS